MRLIAATIVSALCVAAPLAAQDAKPMKADLTKRKEVKLEEPDVDPTPRNKEDDKPVVTESEEHLKAETESEAYKLGGFGVLSIDSYFSTMRASAVHATEEANLYATTFNLRMAPRLGYRFDDDFAIFGQFGLGLELGGQSTTVRQTRFTDKKEKTRGEALGGGIDFMLGLSGERFTWAVGYEARILEGSPLFAGHNDTQTVGHFGHFFQVGYQLSGPAGTESGSGISFRWYPRLQRTFFDQQSRAQAYSLRLRFHDIENEEEDSILPRGWAHTFVEVGVLEAEERFASDGWFFRIGATIGVF